MIIKISKLDRVDLTACDKLIQELQSLISRGIHVKLVRKMSKTSDNYSRYQLRSLMTAVNTYPSMKIAMWSLKNEHDNDSNPRTPKDWVKEAGADAGEGEPREIIPGDRPIMTIEYHVGNDKASERNAVELFCDIKGTLSFMQSGAEWEFMADCASSKEAEPNENVFEKLRIYSAKENRVLADYRDGKWLEYDEGEKDSIDYSLSTITSYISAYASKSASKKGKEKEKGDGGAAQGQSSYEVPGDE